MRGDGEPLESQLRSGSQSTVATRGLGRSREKRLCRTIKGLVINRFGDVGLFIRAPNTVIEGNFIGGTASGDGNFIAFNCQEGVLIAGNAATGNRILRNSIFSKLCPPSWPRSTRCVVAGYSESRLQSPS